jgi:hypothetical protein
MTEKTLHVLLWERLQPRILSLVIIGLGVTASGCQRVPEYTGEELFAQNCASCHGVYGEGDGPVAPALSVVMQDLRYISARNGGEFPRETIRQFIDGREFTAAHGERDMPVWGSAFRRMEGDSGDADARVAARIDALVEVLERIQIDEE